MVAPLEYSAGAPDYSMNLASDQWPTQMTDAQWPGEVPKPIAAAPGVPYFPEGQFLLSFTSNPFLNPLICISFKYNQLQQLQLTVGTLPLHPFHQLEQMLLLLNLQAGTKEFTLFGFCLDTI